ncbi:hypothetical protein Tco_1227963 [Tanacetum coccineum]
MPGQHLLELSISVGVPPFFHLLAFVSQLVSSWSNRVRAGGVYGRVLVNLGTKLSHGRDPGTHPDVKKPVAWRKTVIAAGTSTGLKITNSGVATVSAITVPASVRPDSTSSEPPAVTAVAAFTAKWARCDVVYIVLIAVMMWASGDRVCSVLSAVVMLSVGVTAEQRLVGGLMMGINGYGDGGMEAVSDDGREMEAVVSGGGGGMEAVGSGGGGGMVCSS